MNKNIVYYLFLVFINILMSYVLSHKLLYKYAMQTLEINFFIVYSLINLTIFFLITYFKKDNFIYLKILIASFISGGLSFIVINTINGNLCQGIMCEPQHLSTTITASFVYVFFISKQYISLPATCFLHFLIMYLLRKIKKEIIKSS